MVEKMEKTQQLMPRTVTLRPFKELRIIAANAPTESMQNPQNWLTVKLLSGGSVEARQGSKRTGDKTAVNTAEIFGKEMVPEKEYIIKPYVRTAIFTWGGCVLQLKGNVSQEYESGSTAMKEYLNFACILDTRRELAAIRNTIGPRVLVTGSVSSGKSSVCQLLCNYALKTGWNPIFIELDPRCSTDKDALKFLPGTIGGCVLENMSDEEPSDPLTFYLGSLEVDDTRFFTHFCTALSSAVHLRMGHNLLKTKGQQRKDESNWMGESSSPLIAASGFVINAPWQASKELLYELVEIFKVDVIMVIDNPSLKFNLAERFSMKDASGKPLQPSSYDQNPQSLPASYEGNEWANLDLNSSVQQRSSVSTLAFSKMEGVVEVDEHRLRYLRRFRWRSYFQGDPSAPLKFNTLRMRFSDVFFVQFSTSPAIPLSALPADYEGVYETKEDVYVERWTGPPRNLVNCVVAIAGTDDFSFISRCSIAGMLHVHSVEVISNKSESSSDPTNYVVEFWCPRLVDGKLPSKYVIVPTDLRQLKWLPELS